MSENEQHATQLERLIGMTEVLGALDSDEIRAALAAGVAALRKLDEAKWQERAVEVLARMGER